MQVAADIAGHADMATTKQFYLSVSGDDLGAARRATADLWVPLDADEPLEENQSDSDKVTPNCRHTDESSYRLQSYRNASLMNSRVYAISGDWTRTSDLGFMNPML